MIGSLSPRAWALLIGGCVGALWASVPLGLYASALALGPPALWAMPAGGTPDHGLGWALPVVLGLYLGLQPPLWRRAIAAWSPEALRAGASVVPAALATIGLAGAALVLHPAALLALGVAGIGAWGLLGARWVRARGGTPIGTWRLGWRLGWRSTGVLALVAWILALVAGVGLLLSSWPALALAGLVVDPEPFGALGTLPWSGPLSAALQLHRWLVQGLGVGLALVAGGAVLLCPGHVLLHGLRRGLLTEP